MIRWTHRSATATALVAMSGLAAVLLSATERSERQPVETSSSRAWSAQDQELMRATLLEKKTKLLREGPKRFDQPLEAQQFYVQQRLPLGQTELPTERLYNELQNLQAREKSLVKRDVEISQPGGITSWTAIGPGNIGGRTRTIVIDPVDPSTMYAAGVTGGIWKSIDAGASWNAADDLLPVLSISTIAMDPTNPDILYAGTGEGVFGSWSKHRGLGIFKSTDRGESWNLLPATAEGAAEGAFYFVNKIVISLNDSNIVYAGTMSGVWKSLDAGLSWSVVLRNPWVLAGPVGVPVSNGCSVGCTDLAIRTDSSPDVLFAAFGSFSPDGLYRSDDGGSNWVGYQMPPEQGRITIAIAPSNNDRIYLLMSQNQSGAFGRLYSLFRSDDGGDTWVSPLDFAHPFSEWLLSYVSIATGCFESPVIYSQGWYDNIIAVDPVDPDVVWTGGIDVYRSDNAGETFGLTGYWFYYRSDPIPPTYIHPDNHAIVFHPQYDGISNQTMFVGNDGGMFKTQNALAATTQEECPIGLSPGPPPEIVWENLNNGYGVTQFYHGDAAANADAFAAGAQDNGTSRVNASDSPNSWKMVFGGDGGYVAIDPTNDQRMFVEIQGFPEIRVSHDGGTTFELSVDGITDTDGLFITPFTMDQTNPDILWTGGSRPWRTTDGAVSWEVAGPNLAGASTISAIAIAPSDSNVVYLGFSDGYVAQTKNALAPSPSWTLLTDGLYGGAWVSSIAVDPQNSDMAYCTYSNYGIPHVFRKWSGSTRWVAIDGQGQTAIPDIPVHWVAVRPCDNDQLYVGTELGAFASDDRGATWEPVNVGLAHTIVETLDFKDRDTLVAFTHGRGAFMAELEPCEVAPIPAVSQWGLAVLALIILSAATILLGRQARLRPDARASDQSASSGGFGD